MTTVMREQNDDALRNPRPSVISVPSVAPFEGNNR